MTHVNMPDNNQQLDQKYISNFTRQLPQPNVPLCLSQYASLQPKPENTHQIQHVTDKQLQQKYDNRYSATVQCDHR